MQEKLMERQPFVERIGPEFKARYESNLHHFKHEPKFEIEREN